MEAVRYVSHDARGSWIGEARSCANSYSSPVALGQVMSANDARPSYFWARGGYLTAPPSPTVLLTGKAVGEDPIATRADETVGYIVVNEGASSLGSLLIEAGVATGIAGYGSSGVYHRAGLRRRSAGAAGMQGGGGEWPICMAKPKPHCCAAVDEDRYWIAARTRRRAWRARRGGRRTSPNQGPTANPQTLTTPYETALPSPDGLGSGSDTLTPRS